MLLSTILCCGLWWAELCFVNEVFIIVLGTYGDDMLYAKKITYQMEENYSLVDLFMGEIILEGLGMSCGISKIFKDERGKGKRNQTDREI